MVPRAIVLTLCVFGSLISYSSVAQVTATTLSNGWVSDAAQVFLNVHPARGRFQRRPFVARQAIVEKIEVFGTDSRFKGQTPNDFDAYAIDLMAGGEVTENDLASLAFGTEARADRFEITLYVQPGKTIGHRTITVSGRGATSGVAFRGDKEFLAARRSPVEVTLVPRGGSAAEPNILETAAHDFTLRLRIDEATETKLTGAIYLCINDEKRSFVEGCFTARSMDDLARGGILKRTRALQNAIRSGDVAKLRTLLQETRNPNARLYADRDLARVFSMSSVRGHETLLTATAARGELGCVQALLTAGADINLPNGGKRTPLMAAAYSGNVKMVDLLLAHGAKTDYVGASGYTVLHFAVFQTDNVDVCKRLVAAGADINAADDNGQTPLIQAVRLEQLDTARWLVDHHADVNHKDRQGHTAFYYADTDAMRVLLYQAGAQPQ
jgi:hypothetical protein